jgi:hypothetical protein
MLCRTTLCAKPLEEAGYGKYVRNTEGYQKMAKNYLMLLQPGFALFSIAGILFIFILCSALWWDTTATAAEIFAVFGPVSPSPEHATCTLHFHEFCKVYTLTCRKI